MWSTPSREQRAVAGLAHVLGPPVDGARGRVVGVAHDAELGGDDRLVAVPGQRLADEHLVGVRPVHVGGVEEGDPELERPVDGGDGLVVVARPVEVGHPHAAEALAGHHAGPGFRARSFPSACGAPLVGGSGSGRCRIAPRSPRAQLAVGTTQPDRRHRVTPSPLAGARRSPTCWPTSRSGPSVRSPSPWPSWPRLPVKCPNRTGARGGTCKRGRRDTSPDPGRGARALSARAGRWVSSASYLKKWSVLGVVIGAVAGLGAIVFYEALVACTHFFLGVLRRLPGADAQSAKAVRRPRASAARPWALPLIAGLRRTARRGLRLPLRPRGRRPRHRRRHLGGPSQPPGVRFRAVIVKIVASALTIGSGGSGGREGPTGPDQCGFGSLARPGRSTSNPPTGV